MSDAFHTTKKTIVLDQNEKDAMKAAIVVMPIVSPYRWRLLRLRAIGTALFLIAFGAVSSAAEHTVPGEYLYPIKVHVNERMVQVLSITTESKVKQATRIIDRRLEEVEGILGSDTLGVEEKSQAIASISNTTTMLRQDASEKIEELKNEGEEGEALALSSELEATLAAHADRLEETITGGFTIISSLEQLQNQIEQGESIVSGEGEEIIDDIATDAIDAVHEIQTILDSIDEGYREFEAEARHSADSNTNAAAVALYRSSVEIRASGDAHLQAGRVSDAVAAYADALTSVRQAIKLLIE